MAENVIDFTEPNPLVDIEAVGNVEDGPWLWRIELYLASKYAPEFVESSIFKMRTAALARHRVVIENHQHLQGIQALDNALSADLMRIPLVPQNTPHRRTYAQSPGIGINYQRQIDQEFGE